MANPEHVAKLKEGVKTWNVWREKHLDEWPDLREANLSGADLSGASLSSDQLCTAGTLAQVILDSLLAVDVCNDCPDKFGHASLYADGDPRRCGEGVSVE